MLKRVVIKNFKSLDVDVTLDPVTVLVGRSGTGKTNFVQGLRFLRDYLRGDRDRRDWPSLISATLADEETLAFSVTFDLEDGPGTFEYLLELNYRTDGTRRSHRERLSLEGNVLFHHRNGSWLAEPRVVDPPKPSGVVLSALEGIQEVSIAHVLLTKGLACFDFPGNVCTGDSATEGGSNGLLDSADNYRQAFDAITSDLKRLGAWKEINSALKCLNRSFAAVDAKKGGAKRLVVSHDFNGRILVFDIAQESEGFRRFFAHLLALHQSPPKETMVFEEPEKGIHPGALETLAEELRTCPEEGRGQVILTTHSPALLDYFDPSALRVVVIEGGVTSIGPVATGQLAALKQKLLTPGELLTVDPARIEPANPAEE